MECIHPEESGRVDLLYAVRHGQSTSNLAALKGISGDGDDSVIALTERGGRQAAAVGRYLVSLDADERPELVLCSPYLRAVQTWQFAAAELRAANLVLPCHRIDQRLYDRRRGVLTHLSRSDRQQRFPEELAKEEHDPLDYRPPEGESFRDVESRLRPVVSDIRADHRHRRVLIVAHDAVVLFLRQILELLSDAEVLAIADDGLAGNGSITSWHRAGERYELRSYDQRAHLPGAASRRGT